MVKGGLWQRVVYGECWSTANVGLQRMEIYGKGWSTVNVGLRRMVVRSEGWIDENRQTVMGGSVVVGRR